MQLLMVGFFSSMLATLFALRFSHLYMRHAGDPISGVQKVHAQPVPRIGGVPIFVALICAGLWLMHLRPELSRYFWLLIAVSLPAFLGGLVEDITKQVRPRYRLLLTMAAAALGFWLLNAGLVRADVPGLDNLLAHWWFALFLTATLVAGVTNAINIIDGFNGLAAMVSIMILAAIAYTAFRVNDLLVLHMALATVGAIGGFLIWNYPRGLIFLGDGGAYLIGFIIGELSVLLVARNAIVSPWFPMLLVIYPVFETLFSVYRRVVLRGSSPASPDGLHLHMLVYKRLVAWAAGEVEARHAVKRNARTSPYLWVLSSLSVAPAIVFYNNTALLIVSCAAFALIYVWLYWSIVKFKTPALISRRARQLKSD
jgi:UDP-GlcNAc:undecaprenyl-phosphate/decaprenyl-phosphate GlcNAc-1-phosphate transferase